MKSIRILAALFALAATGGVHAGKTGAGPAGSAAPGVGAIITPGSSALLDTPARDDNSDRVLPGNGGVVTLEGEGLARAAERLRGFEGAYVQNTVIKAPTVLADGTPAVIALDTRTGELRVTRQER